MKIKLKILFTAVCISLTLQVNAIQSILIEKNAALTLNDCIKIALNNSPVVKKYILNLDIAKSSVGVAKSAYFPSLSLGTSYKQNFGERSHNFGSYQSRTLPGFDASLSQLLWNFGKTDAYIRMEKFNRIAAEFDFDETILYPYLGYIGLHSHKPYYLTEFKKELENQDIPIHEIKDDELWEACFEKDNKELKDKIFEECKKEIKSWLYEMKNSRINR